MPNSEIFEFNWTVENFSVLFKVKSVLRSQYFRVPFFGETKWSLSLYEYFDFDTEKENLHFFIAPEDGTDPLPIGCTFTLKSVDTSRNVTLKEEHVEIAPGMVKTCNVIPLQLLSQNKDIYLPCDVLTVKFLIWNPGAKSSIPKTSLNVELAEEQCSSITRMPVSKRFVTWPIPKVKELLYLKGNHSIDIESSLDQGPSFRLSLLLGVDPNYAQIRIFKTSSTKEVFVKWRISVMSNDPEYNPSSEDSYLFLENDPLPWRLFPKFIAVSHIEDDKYVYLDNTLYLSCEFSYVYEDSPISYTEKPGYIHSAFKVAKPTTESPLSKNVQKLYSSRRFCDITLQVDDRIFNAHKVVLCAHSPVFCAMFENDMKEKSTSVVEIDDVDADTIERMLGCLHSDTLEDCLSAEDICHLYSAADKYQILHLKQQCTRLLLSSLSAVNVCEILIVADGHEDHFLMGNIYNFLKIHGSECFHSPQWEKFLHEYPFLCGKVMLEVFKNR